MTLLGFRQPMQALVFPVLAWPLVEQGSSAGVVEPTGKGSVGDSWAISNDC